MGGHHVTGVWLVVVVVVGIAVVVVEVSVVVVDVSEVELSVVVVEVSVLAVEGVSIVVGVSSACAGAGVTCKNMPTPSTNAKMSMAGERSANGAEGGTQPGMPLPAGAGGEGLPKRINRRLKRCSRPISPNTTFPRVSPFVSAGSGEDFCLLDL